jgi:hypothetical protein
MQGEIYRGGFWIRFWRNGPGVSIVDHKINPMLFSCRYVRKSRAHVGRFCFRWLASY